MFTFVPSLTIKIINMNLKQKLKPEYLVKLEGIKEEQPYNYKEVNDALEGNDHLINVPFGTIILLSSLASCTLGNIWDIFKNK